MKDKRELPSREVSRRGSKAVQEYDEKMPRRKSKVAGPQDDRDRDSPQPKHRSMAIRPHEKERDQDTISHYQGRSSHASKVTSSEEAQKAIRNLFMHVKEAMSFFAGFKEEYLREVRGVEAYASQTILEKLWERKIKNKDTKSRSTKSRSKEDGVGLRSGFDDVSARLWDSLENAYEGVVSHPPGHNDSMARKLDAALNDLGNLLKSVRTNVQETDNLVKELKVLRVVLELDGAGTVSHDDRVNQRPGAHAAGHERRRESSLQREDVRYGEIGEDSGSEDNDQRDEQHGQHSERSRGRDEREDGGDGEGQGPFSTDDSVF